MDINTSIDISETDNQQLAGILRVSEAALGDRLGPFIRAAAEEYVRMMLGQKVYTRGSDIREYRLFLLIMHAFDGSIPDEQTVCDLFQTTVTQSRSLLRSVMSKYQYDLGEAIESTLRKVLGNATKDETTRDFDIVVNSESIVEVINRKLAVIDGSLPQMVKKRGTVATFTMRPSSLERLRQVLGT